MISEASAESPVRSCAGMGDTVVIFVTWVARSIFPVRTAWTECTLSSARMGAGAASAGRCAAVAASVGPTNSSPKPETAAGAIRDSRLSGGSCVFMAGNMERDGGRNKAVSKPPPTAPNRLHVGDDVVPEFAALNLRRPVHQPGEIVSHALAADCPIQSLHDQVRSLVPPHVAEHHLAAQHHAARIHHVLARVLRRR